MRLRNGDEILFSESDGEKKLTVVGERGSIVLGKEVGAAMGWEPDTMIEISIDPLDERIILVRYKAN